LSLEGICTHLASSDNPDRDFSDEQLRRFHRVLDQCGQRGIHFQVRHVSNSAALLRERTWHLDGVRAGIVLYGYPPVLPGERPRADLRPVLQWKTRLVQVKRVPRGFPVSYDSTHTTERETRIGTFPVGYADGYPRALSNRAQVLVHGRRAPVVGRVTMNLSMVDLGPDSLAQAGDEVVLLGEQGGASLWADELARWAGTIPYEVLTNIRAIDRRVVE
jgi:alanine racemase